MKQRDLFPQPSPAPKPMPERYAMEPFDFERDADFSRMVPQPGVVIPEECRLPTDDENWQPGSG
jgi:hypothetical protein